MQVDSLNHRRLAEDNFYSIQMTTNQEKLQRLLSRGVSESNLSLTRSNIAATMSKYLPGLCQESLP